MPNKQLNLKINNLPIAAAVDGHQISINDNTGDADLIFFQINPMGSSSETMDGVATAHLRLSLNQIEHLMKDLADGIKKFESNHK